MNTITNFIKGNPRIILALLTFLLGLTIYQCFRIQLLKNPQPRKQLVEKVKIKYLYTNNSNERVENKKDKRYQPDYTSVYISEDTFKKEQPYEAVLQPKEIIYWNRDEVTAAIQDTAQMMIKGTQNLNRYIIPQQPESIPESNYDSLVQFKLSRKKLTVSTYNTGQYTTSSYDLDLARCSYIYSPLSGLTYQERGLFEISPYLNLSHQVFTSVTSLGMGISFKTSNIDYNLGISLNRDQEVNPQLRPDIGISIIYKFKPWLSR